jgi:hypothetical protein
VTDFEIGGVPVTVDDAHALWKKSPLAFERWAVKALGGYTPGRQTGDRGIDGKAHFKADAGVRGTVVISVKGGATVTPMFARDLGHVITEHGNLGVLIMFGPVSKGVKDEMNASGSYMGYPRMQVVTVEELLSGKPLNLPALGTS